MEKLTEIAILGVVTAGLSSYWIAINERGMIFRKFQQWVYWRLYEEIHTKGSYRIAPKYRFSVALEKVLFLCTTCNSTWINIFLSVYGFFVLDWPIYNFFILTGITTASLCFLADRYSDDDDD